MEKEKPTYILYDLAFADRHPELSAIDLLIYHRIKGYADKFGQYSLPLSDLAKRVHSSEDTVRRALHHLLERGLIEETKENGKTTAYRPLANCDPSQNATPRKMLPHPSQNATPNNKIIIKG